MQPVLPQLQAAQARVARLEQCPAERSIVSRQEARIRDLESQLDFQAVQMKRFEVPPLRRPQRGCGAPRGVQLACERRAQRCHRHWLWGKKRPGKGWGGLGQLSCACGQSVSSTPLPVRALLRRLLKANSGSSATDAWRNTRSLPVDLGTVCAGCPAHPPQHLSDRQPPALALPRSQDTRLDRDILLSPLTSAPAGAPGYVFTGTSSQSCAPRTRPAWG